MKFLRITSQILIIIGGIAIFGYFYHIPLENLFVRLQMQYFPCTSPISYSIGSFDPRFGITRDRFLDAVGTAEAIWEKPLGKELFASSSSGKLKINLIYDDRQAATAKLQKLGIAVKDDQATYDKVKAKYESLVADNKHKLAALDTRIAAFEVRNDAYNAEVAHWNERGGATPDAYNRLLDEKAALQTEVAQIKKLQNEFNAEVENINATVEILNRLAQTLHIEAANYNVIGSAHAGEFTEGEYTSGPEGIAINIYQFDDKGKLVRVLAHELGHALGLEHVEDTKAIMYRLNDGVNEKLTASDLAALKSLCRVK